jgi:hypothetical protein
MPAVAIVFFAVPANLNYPLRMGFAAAACVRIGRFACQGL